MKTIAKFLGDIAEVIEDVAEKMPDHGEFVRELPTSTPRQKRSASSPAASVSR